MKKIFIVFLALFFGTMIVHGYECKTITKEENYDLADFVFLGEVTAVNGKTFEIVVEETFKGGLPRKVYAQLDDYSIMPNKGEVWLFYAKKHSKNTIFISQCSWSRSFEDPFCIYSTNFPLPPPQNSGTNNQDLLLSQYKSIAISELNTDILNLRHLKFKKEISDINILYKELEQQNREFKTQILLLKWVIFSLIILILGYIIFLLARNKNN
jgi:hypothetical protein